MEGFLFTPDFTVINTIKGQWGTEKLLEQQGMFGADINFAYKHAQSTLTAILDAIPDWYHEDAHKKGMELNIDVRVHELSAGDYPASPGWHCDAPQRETAFSDTQDRVPVSNSLVVNVSDQPEGVSNTVFTTEPVWLDDGSMTYTSWQELDHRMSTDLTKPAYQHTRDGEMVMFSPYTPHCIQPARQDGVRMFVRISQWVKPEGFQPGLTKNEQVYRTVPTYNE